MAVIVMNLVKIMLLESNLAVQQTYHVRGFVRHKSDLSSTAKFDLIYVNGVYEFGRTTGLSNRTCKLILSKKCNLLKYPLKSSFE
jgi:hypothetical protein